MSALKFDKTRCKILSKCTEVMKDCKGILYWMCRDYRVQDNWSMLFAQKLARKNQVPLFVCVFGKPHPTLIPTRRHYKFFIEGLKEIAGECKSLDVNFHFINEFPDRILDVVKKNGIGAVVCDFFPLRKVTEWVESVRAGLPDDVAFIQVDAHNIVPVWVASEKQETAARTIRPKINKKLPQYLVDFPVVTQHEYNDFKLDLNGFDLDLEGSLGKFREAVRCLKVDDVSWAQPGTKSGLRTLETFIKTKLKFYEKSASDPAKDVSSNLSPWIHFGHISAQRCALRIQEQKNSKGNVERFLEELIIRRELTDNYCHYNENYDNFNGADNWARITLNAHRKDKRKHIYTKEQFEQAKTHDLIWNAAQVQLVENGKIHNYMRMYWCKKILEWSGSPEEAIEIGLYLNDTYSLDGSDPNGFVGVMWSICGVHDHGWAERDIFGKIRWMVDTGLRRKFDIDVYVAKWGTKLKKIEYVEDWGEDGDCEPNVKRKKME